MPAVRELTSNKEEENPLRTRHFINEPRDPNLHHIWPRYAPHWPSWMVRALDRPGCSVGITDFHLITQKLTAIRLTKFALNRCVEVAKSTRITHIGTVVAIVGPRARAHGLGFYEKPIRPSPWAFRARQALSIVYYAMGIHSESLYIEDLIC
jgi:hypothetical protein